VTQRSTPLGIEDFIAKYNKRDSHGALDGTSRADVDNLKLPFCLTAPVN
jgi:hypothetical protein